MVEPLLCGIVLGIITISMFGLFIIAFCQFLKADQFYM